MGNPEYIPVNPASSPHPGRIVLDYLDSNGWSQQDLARRTGLTPKTVSELCNGRTSITASTALEFEKVFQRPAHLWLGLQSRFDEAVARQRHASAASSADSWAKLFPVREMKRLNFSLPPADSDAESLLRFFGVSSPESWDTVWQSPATAFRQTGVTKYRREAIAAWIRETELVARGLALADYSEASLRGSLAGLRQLTRKRADEIMEPIQAVCAEAGVAVVLVPALPNTGISGCARWISDRNALIGLTLRYKYDDQLWFSFFHEVAHILIHRGKRVFVIDNADTLDSDVVDPELVQFEAEANRFARDLLIPPLSLAEFVRTSDFSNRAIFEFADKCEVGPGIVVGRLQHDRILKPYQGNTLKQKLGSGNVE